MQAYWNMFIERGSGKHSFTLSKIINTSTCISKIFGMQLEHSLENVSVPDFRSCSAAIEVLGCVAVESTGLPDITSIAVKNIRV